MVKPPDETFTVPLVKTLVLEAVPPEDTVSVPPALIEAEMLTPPDDTLMLPPLRTSASRRCRQSRSRSRRNEAYRWSRTAPLDTLMPPEKLVAPLSTPPLKTTMSPPLIVASSDVPPAETLL